MFKKGTNREEIRVLCQKLNLHNLAKIKSFEKKDIEEKIDYFKYLLEYEIEERRKNVVENNRAASNLPDADLKGKFTGIDGWNLDSTKKLAWFESGKSLLIYGKCGSGKTDLACQVCDTVLENKNKVYYVKMKPFIEAFKSPLTKEKDFLIRKCEQADLIVLDELLYLPITGEDLKILYEKVMGLLDERQFIFISCHWPQDWRELSEDKITMDTFCQRVVNYCRQFRLK